MIRQLIYKLKSAIAQVETGLLHRRASRYGYELKIRSRQPDAERIIENYFQTAFEKNALISYIIYPFTGDILSDHSNHQECLAIAEICKELGFNVDVINWDNDTYVPNKEYSVVIDNHNNLKRLAPYLKASTCQIFHATNAYWIYQNKVEYERCLNFYKEFKMPIKPTRLRPEGNSIFYADVVSMFGNGFTASTYGAVKSRIHHLPMSVTAKCENLRRNWEMAKTKFIWLNSHGALLKGLDNVIKAFAQLPSLELFICSDTSKDKEFFNAMQQTLMEAKNIRVMGWLEMESDLFQQLASDCCWVISTSWSEGGGGSVLNCMAKGLIPIISKSVSITLPENGGYYIDNTSLEKMTADILYITETAPDKLSAMAERSYQFVRENHTPEVFKQRYRSFLKSALASNRITPVRANVKSAHVENR